VQEDPTDLHSEEGKGVKKVTWRSAGVGTAEGEEPPFEGGTPFVRIDIRLLTGTGACPGRWNHSEGSAFRARTGGQ